MPRRRSKLVTLVALPTLIAADRDLSAHGTTGRARILASASDLVDRVRASLSASTGIWHPERPSSPKRSDHGMAMGPELAVGRAARFGVARALSHRQRGVPAALSRRCRALLPGLAGQCRGAPRDPEGSRRHAGAAHTQRQLRPHHRRGAQPRHASSPTTCCAPISAGFAASCRRSRSSAPILHDIDMAAWQPARTSRQRPTRRVLRRRRDAAVTEHRRCEPQDSRRETRTVQELAGDRFRDARKRADPRLFPDVSIGNSRDDLEVRFCTSRRRKGVSDLSAEAARQ